MIKEKQIGIGEKKIKLRKIESNKGKDVLFAATENEAINMLTR